MDIISVDGLTKKYNSGWPWRPPFMVLSGLSFSVAAGEIYGFLGPNGSGKTTTLKILMGLMRESSGAAKVFGYPAGDIRAKARTGFLPESPYFYDYLTAEEFLGFYGRLAGLDRDKLSRRTSEMLHLVGLADARHQQLRKFSKGMLQRVGLAQALIHDPELIVLDEPMSGLDPLGRKLIRDVILSLKDRGKTIFFSSHIIPDVEMICDRVGILMRGKLIATGRVDELVRRDQVQSVEVVCEEMRADQLAGIMPFASRLVQRGGQSLIMLQQSDHLEQVLAEIRKQGGHLVSVTPHKGTLEELFVQPSQSLSDVRG